MILESENQMLDTGNIKSMIKNSQYKTFTSKYSCILGNSVWCI